MEQQELLVHVTAPSRLRDDRRYQSLASQLHKFELAAITHVYGFVGLASGGATNGRSATSGLSFHETTTTKPTCSTRPPSREEVVVDVLENVLVVASPTIGISTKASLEAEPAAVTARLGGHFNSTIHDSPVDRIDLDEGLGFGGSGKSGIGARCMGQWQVGKGPNPNKILHAHRICNNLPFKNPLHNIETSYLASQAVRTPEAKRPRTAPADATGTIQVPRTLNKAHKRSASDSLLDGSFMTSRTISDSQLGKDSVYSRSEGSERAEPELTAVASHAVERGRNVRPTKQPRLGMLSDQDLVMMDEANDTSEMHTEASTISIGTAAGQNYLVRPPHGCTGPFFLRDRSEDWTSPPEPSVTDSSDAISSTLSPSQPLPLRLSQTQCSPSALPQPNRVVDLTVENREFADPETQDVSARRVPSSSGHRSQSLARLAYDPIEDSPNSATRSFRYDGGLSIQATKTQDDQPSRSTSFNSNRRYDFTTSIRGLPDLIQAPPPPIGNGIFTTHVSSALSTLLARLPLAQYFRPAKVTRDVRVLERGHWMLRVKIASIKEVAEARRVISKGELFKALQGRLDEVNSTQADSRYEVWKAASDDLSGQASKRCDLWTEDEFLGFWDVLKKYIEDGKAGHGLSVTKDWDCEAVTPGRSTQSIYARIRVYTWGEVVGHIWIALWVLSDKRTAYVPMEWLSADGSMVVKMSGSRHKGGKLGPWVSKASPGGKGSWGVATATGTPPYNQGKYLHIASGNSSSVP
jgi:hypothetical protein